MRQTLPTHLHTHNSFSLVTFIFRIGTYLKTPCFWRKLYKFHVGNSHREDIRTLHERKTNKPIGSRNHLTYCRESCSRASCSSITKTNNENTRKYLERELARLELAVSNSIGPLEAQRGFPYVAFPACATRGAASLPDPTSSPLGPPPLGAYAPTLSTRRRSS